MGWETSAGGDYRRILADEVENEPNYWGGAGAPQQYAYQKAAPGGVWNWWNPGEHDEAASYSWAGVNSPQYLEALSARTPSPLQQSRLQTPGALGQALTRSEASLTGGSNEDDFRQELAFLSSVNGVLPGMENYLTPQMQTAIRQQINDSSATAQDARAGDGDSFGDLMKLAALAAAVYSGGSALGAWGGSSGAGAISAADAAAAMGSGVDAAGWGVLDALGGAGSALPDYINTLGEWPAAADSVTTARPEWLDSLLNPVENPNKTYAPWSTADSSLPVGADEWLRSAGQGTTMSNGQTINLPEWIANNPAAARAVGVTAPGFFEKLLQSVGDNKSAASSIARALGLGDTAAGIAGLLPKLLSGLDMVNRNREALSANDARLREAKDTTPLAPSSWNMLRRAKGGLAQCAACAGDQGNGEARYVSGGTSGQADKIPALLSDGEYVFDADVVSALGDGNNAAGAAALDQMRENIRRHKRAAPATKIPPKAKAPERYLKGGK